jgi:hypothetical protein
MDLGLIYLSISRCSTCNLVSGLETCIYYHYQGKGHKGHVEIRQVWPTYTSGAVVVVWLLVFLSFDRILFHKLGAWYVLREGSDSPPGTAAAQCFSGVLTLLLINMIITVIANIVWC